MESEEFEDDSHLTSPPSLGNPDSRDSSPPLLTALQPTTLHGHSEGSTHQPSLWILDTNTLMSCLDLLKALFAALLTRNVAYAAAMGQQGQQSALPTRPTPIRLVIPYVVVSELDGLKVTRRKDDSGRPVASQAREANHWLLSALQKQKRVPVDEAGSHLAEDLWPLFVQPSTHYHRSKRSNGPSSRFTFEDTLSCDDEIIKFCADLKTQTPSPVCFCSDDINARTKAELDGIESLGMRELAKALKLGLADVQSSERKWTLVADALIEQWEYQAGIAEQPQDSLQDHQQYPAMHPQQHIDQHLNQPSWHPSAISPHNVAGKDGDPYASNLQGAYLGPSNRIKPINEMVEVEMETEEQQNTPVIPTSPIPTSSASGSHGRPIRLASPSNGGRSTIDSIHNPQNTQHSNRSGSHSTNLSPSRTLQQDEVNVATIGQQQDAEGEALNPQISWEDLMGPSTRAASRARNGRW